MLLKSIKLKNFRQIKEGKINFAIDNYKNVTIIMGNNGSGKTTLTQAFKWCFYGKTDFKIKKLLNQEIENSLLPGQGTEVEVEIELLKDGANYTLNRKIFYEKKNNELKSNNSILNVIEKLKSGNSKIYENAEGKLIVNRILSEELSKYFFFDGERIEGMSKEIQSGKKSSEFSDAVKGLLGLEPFFLAKEHLAPKRKSTVIGLYNNEYDTRSSFAMNECSEKIDNYNRDILELKKEIDNYGKSYEDNQKIYEQESNKLRDFEESQKDEKRKEALEIDVKRIKNNITDLIKENLRKLNKDLLNFSYNFLIEDVVKKLKQEGLESKDIPDMYGKTIEKLIERGECICGTHIEKGNEAYKNLKELLKLLPPQSLGISIKEFLKDCKRNNYNRKELYKFIKNNYSKIVKDNALIEDKQVEIDAIDKKLGGSNIDTIIKKCFMAQQRADLDRKRYAELKEKGLINLGRLEKELEKQEEIRGNLSLSNERNKKIEYYRKYALKIYDSITETLSSKEKHLRKKLEEEINIIFKQIYDGGLSIQIDEKYNISVKVKQNITETSTAQSISVIFAFISGIIKLAKEYQKQEYDNCYSEPQPLVMDAPLSSFDKTRIKNVCEVLPKTAEQVIIFIKDTDGDLARNHLGSKAGEVYSLKKINEFRTNIMGKEEM